MKFEKMSFVITDTCNKKKKPDELSNFEMKLQIYQENTGFHIKDIKFISDLYGFC